MIDETMAENTKTSDTAGESSPSDRAAGTGPAPWTPAEEEAISLLMELMPMLAETHAAAKRSWCRKRGSRDGDGKG